MSVTPTGILSLPLDRMRTLLASCEAFQTWVGVDSEDVGTATGIAEAKEHVYLLGLAEGQTQGASARSARRPLVIVSWGEDADGEPDSEPCDYWLHSGSLWVMFEHLADPDSESLSTEDAVLSFANDVGGILEDMYALAGTAGYLTVTQWRKIAGPARMDPESVSAGELDVCQLAIEMAWAET
jgi:hypothetical protein